VRLTEQFLRWLERSQVSPYDYIMNAVDTLGSWLAVKPGYLGSPAQFSFNNLKNALPAVLMHGDLSANYGTNPIADTYCFSDVTSGYADIKDFINNLPNGDDAKSLALGIDRMLLGHWSGVDNYNARMTYHKSGVYDDAAEKYLRGLLFHYPNMKAYFNDKLAIGLNLSTATFDQVVAAIKAALYPGSNSFEDIRADYIYSYTPAHIYPYLSSYLPSGTPSPTYNETVDNISINAVHLWVRTILVDESENEFSNEAIVSTTDYEASISRKYKHSYNADIWGYERGEIGLIKADRYANQTNDTWRYDISAVDFTKILQGIEGAQFKVYDANTGTLLTFVKTVDANGVSVYAVNNSGITTVTTGKDGVLRLTGLPDEVYLVEIGADGYYTGVQSGTIDVRNGNNVAMFGRPSGVVLRINSTPTKPYP